VPSFLLGCAVDQDHERAHNIVSGKGAGPVAGSGPDPTALAHDGTPNLVWRNGTRLTPQLSPPRPSTIPSPVGFCSGRNPFKLVASARGRGLPGNGGNRRGCGIIPRNCHFGRMPH
jgi:hypothetical protein